MPVQLSRLSQGRLVVGTSRLNYRINDLSVQTDKQEVNMSDVDQTHTSSRLIAASAARIYSACTRAGELKQWIAPKGATAEIERFEAREGGNFKTVLSFESDVGKSSARTDVVLGRFLALVPDESIVQAIDFVSDRPEFAGTMVMSWLFHPSGETTLVSIVARDVPRGISKSDHETGMASSLENLAEFVKNVRVRATAQARMDWPLAGTCCCRQ